ncbi:MAG TPA: DUF3011 domain-containing protein [Candidatus Eremiobacteraceae bacterium]|nr:DUF3011 domain-containing protein [Candidatus Eremiobacteraceae bacterium]
MRMIRVAVGLIVALVAGGVASAQTIHCASDGTKKYCEADTHGGVRLVKERSVAVCKQGESWGYDEHGIWVDHGCDGDFALGTESATSAGGGKALTCSSDGGKKYCDASTGRGVRLVKQLSETACKQDDSWGYDGLGIWVDKGCSAEFELGVLPKAATSAAEDSNTAKDKTCVAQVGKARAEQMVKECLKVSPATHPPCNAQNSCELIEDEIRRSCALLGRDAPAFCGGYK